MRPATLAERLLAAAVDLGIWSGIAVVMLGGPIAGILSLDRPHAEPTLEELFLVLGLSSVTFLLFLLWCILFDVYCYRYERRYGATLGKGLLGLSVRDARTGGLPSREQCLWRELTRPFEMGGIFPAMVAIALDPRNRRIGDRLAGTEVVEATSELERSPFPWVSVRPEAYRSQSARGHAGPLRRALAFFVDLSIVTTLFAPVDLAILVWNLAPGVAQALEGNFDELLNAKSNNLFLWLAIPLYFFYERWSQKRFGDTPGRKLFGVRRELATRGTLAAIRYAVVPFVLFPVTLVEAIARPAKPTLSERLSRARFEQL